MRYLNRQERQTYDKYSQLLLPRHTSYPTINHWDERFGPSDYAQNIWSGFSSDRELSLYIHVPFCRQLCLYCGCTREIVTDDARAKNDPVDGFLSSLQEEVTRIAYVCRRRKVKQIHFGGGTPTFLTPGQFARMWEIIATSFIIKPDAEISVEIDPRVTTQAHLQTMAKLGINRVSLGVQDFDPKVQQAIGREQPFEMVKEFVQQIRAVGIHQINFDLIYGLPFQTLETAADSIEKTISLAPGRISYFRLAQIPDLFKWQRSFRKADMPDATMCSQLLMQAIEMFGNAGYEYIGLDHFAKATDPLAVAYHTGRLTRNFQGMTSGADLDLIGLGPSAVSYINGTYSQNHKSLYDWRRQVNTGFDSLRGKTLSQDDLIRKQTIEQMYCFGSINDQQFKAISDGRTLREYYGAQWSALEELAKDGLIELQDDEIHLTPTLGRMLVRVVASVFDAYIPPSSWRVGLMSGASQI